MACSTTDLAVDVDQFWRQGYLVVRGVFSPQEVLAFRRTALQCKEFPGDMLSEPRLREILLDERVLSIARQVLGGTPVYFGDSALSFRDNVRGFHRDNVDRNDPNAPDWNGRYPIIRMGLYLQDHRREPGGLDLLAGSHENCAERIGKYFGADTGLGDLVLWNLRTLHSGCGWLLRFPRKRLPPDSLLARILNRDPLRRTGLLLSQSNDARLAAFMTFGRKGRHLDRYIAYLRSRKYAVDHWRASSYGHDAWEAVERSDVEVIDLPSEILQDPPGPTNVNHVPLPY